LKLSLVTRRFVRFRRTHLGLRDAAVTLLLCDRASHCRRRRRLLSRREIGLGRDRGLPLRWSALASRLGSVARCGEGTVFFEVLFKFSVCSILLPRSSTLTLSRPGIEPGPTGVPPDSNPVSWPHRRRSWFAVPMASLTPHFEASSRVVGGVVCRPRTSPGPCRVRCAADDESNTRVGVFSRPPPRLQSPTATDTSRKSHG